MSSELERLYTRFDRANQGSKRSIGKYLHQRPAEWIPRQEIVDEFDIDESVVSRHIDSIYEEGFILSKKENNQRYLQWNGRGSGGLIYWVRKSLPPQIWQAGSELRPLFTIHKLGGAYVPMFIFICLIVIGFFTALSTVLIAHHPSDSIFGITVIQLIVFSGMVTVAASVAFLLVPISKLLEMVLSKCWMWILNISRNTKEE